MKRWLRVSPSLEVDEVGPLDHKVARVALDAREVEHRIDEARKPPDLRRDRLEVLVICGQDAVLHRLDGG